MKNCKNGNTLGSITNDNVLTTLCYAIS